MRFRRGRCSPGIALYEAVGSATPWGYFLCTAPGEKPPEHLTMRESWDYPGAYLSSAVDVSGPAPSLEQMVTSLGLSPDARMLAWVRSWQAPIDAVGVSISKSMETVGGNADLALGNLVLRIPRRTAVELTDEGFEFGPGVELRRQNQGYRLTSETGKVSVSLAAPSTGRLRFPASWNAYELFHFCRDKYDSIKPARGGEVRYFYGEEKTLAYPLFEALDPSDRRVLKLDVALDPLAPFDGGRTRMLFRSVPQLECKYGATTSGEPVTLTPLVDGEAPAGFWFGCRPGGPEGPTAVYLAPLGTFALGRGPGGTSGRNDERSLHLMGGTSGLEYLAGSSGDRLVFAAGGAAHAPGFGATLPPSGEPPLRSTYTTSWVRFAPQRGRRAANEAGPAYFGQPDTSPNYATGVIPAGEDGPADGGMTLPTAVASRVRALDAGSNPFPLAFYGGALTHADLPVPSARTLMEFESVVLTPERGTRLRAAAPGDRARGGGAPAGALRVAEPAPPAPVFTDAAGEPLSGRTATPQGFVVDLYAGDDAKQRGKWSQVEFARTATGQTLTVPPGADGTIDPWLATSLVKDKLFLVLNDWSQLPALDWLLSVGGFDFRMAPRRDEPAEDQRQTILVFKSTGTQSLNELIPTTGAWDLSRHFVGDADEVKKTREALEGALVAARKTPTDDPFGRFREIAADPTWTGMLAFNCLVPGTGMPADLQMLYAGIKGKLRAHHFGVELNRISGDGSKVEITESSLFGVIHYQGELQRPEHPQAYQFAVEELGVELRNSAVIQFHAKVLLEANELFGREVVLAPAGKDPNTITLAGQYQRNGTVGTVSFALLAPQGASFGFAVPGASVPPVRILDSLSVGGASLVPVTTAGGGAVAGGAAEVAGETKRVTAQVSLNGELTFAAAPIPGAPELDLFSYGDNERGVGLSGLGLTLECDLHSDGSKGPTTIKPDLPAVVLNDPGKAARRPEGLVEKLPLTLKGLLHEENGGLDPAKLGALPVNVTELAGAQGAVASKPRYALQFSLPLGTLGGLADAHASLEASLLLGWGPSTYSPDDDGIGIFVQLPFFSAGAFGLDLQGLLKTTFGDANLMRVKTGVGTAEERAVYVVLFNNISVSLLGLKFPPRVIVDFILFAGPETSGGGNLGWSLAAVEPKPPAQEIEARPALTEPVG